MLWSLKSKNLLNLFFLLIILLVLGLLYRRFEDKRMREESIDNDQAIQEYLLNDDGLDLAKSSKPILWIHVPYEYNSRKWASFGSRSSMDLNQPYLYLTVRSIIEHCESSFKVCIIDDHSFKRLIPGWNLDVDKVSSPILDNIRQMGLLKLIYLYGGMVCPVSFLCMKNLLGLYEKGIRGGKMFLCEMNNRNITSTSYSFYPSLQFCGAEKENETVKELIDFVQRTSSYDFTAQSEFLGDFDRWCYARIRSGRIHMIPGTDIGVKTVEDQPILLEDLMSQQYLKLYNGAYGIYIPADEILKRRHYEWFARLSQKQVLESNTIIGNYLLLYSSPNTTGKFLEPMKQNNRSFVGFWKMPSDAPVYGLKPMNVGENVRMLSYPNS